MAVNQFGQTQMPVANQQVADQQVAANALAMQNQFRNLSVNNAMSGGMQAAQQMGADLAAKQGAVEVGRVQAVAQKAIQDTTNQLVAKQLDVAKRNSDINRAIEQNRMNREKSLSQLGRDIQHKIVDSQYRFAQTARGLQLADERQYEDFLTLQQADENRWQSHLQAATQANQQTIQALQFAYDTFSRIETQSFKQGQQTLNQASLARIRKRKQDIEAAQKRARKRAGRNQAMLGGVKMIVGTAVVATSVVGGFGTGGAAWAGASTGTQLIASGASDYQQGTGAQGE